MNKRNDFANKNIPSVSFDKMNSEERIMFTAGGFKPPKGRPEEEILESILENKEQRNTRQLFPAVWSVRAVAAVFIALLIGYAGFIVFSQEKITTGYAEHTELTLPDGTEVVLNAASKMVWAKKPFSSKRSLKLKGEAFLNVKKGDKFIIKTKNGNVEILGTKLNILSRNDQFKVSCMEGKVKVSANNRQQIISSGEFAELTENGLVKKRVENIEVTSLWRQGIFHFENTPLGAIFAEFERQFNITVDFKGNNNRLATVDFSNENLEQALEVVCIPMELKYEVQNNKKVIISEKN